MNKILFLYEMDTGTKNILQEMFDGSFKRTNDITEDDINAHDIIFFIRPADILSYSIAKRAKQSGRFVISFYDDDLLNYMRISFWGHCAAKKILWYSDVLLSFNAHLCEKYLKYTRTKRAVKIDMLVKEQQIHTPSQHCNDKIKIVYAASSDHIYLFDEIVRPALPEIISKYGNKFSLTFVKVSPDLKEFSDKLEINYVKSMPLLEYRKFMAKQNFDVGIAPLHDNEFNRCKYFNKYVEYSLSGIFGIYSDVEPYRNIVKDKQNGLLVSNTKEEWCEALESVILNFNAVFKDNIQIAQDDLRKNFSEEKIMHELAEKIPEFFRYEVPKNTAKSCKSFKFKKFIYNHMDIPEALYRIIYRSCFYLKKGGIKNLISRSIDHFKRKR